MIAVVVAILFTCTPVDADTVDCREQGKQAVERVRLVNVDAPELFSPSCDAERAQARRATEFTRAWLARGPVEIVVATERKSWNRIIAYVRRGADDLGEALIAAGHARPCTGRKENWCGGGAKG